MVSQSTGPELLEMCNVKSTEVAGRKGKNGVKINCQRVTLFRSDCLCLHYYLQERSSW